MVPTLGPRLRGRPPTFRWFVGGQTNLAYNALDHHVRSGRGGHAALIALNERGERRVFTYAQLLTEVERDAAALRGLGVGRGDRVTIYMPTCPEAIVADAGDVRIGAIHLGRLRRLRRGALGDRIRGQRLEGRVHRRRHVPQGQGRRR